MGNTTITQIVWIARHGNRQDFVDLNWRSQAQHPLDPPLSTDGAVQAQELAARLAGETIAHIFASPFLRTVQTASYVAELLDLPIKIESGLSEWIEPQGFLTAPAKLTFTDLVEQFPRIDANYRSRVEVTYPEPGKMGFDRAAKTAQLLTSEFAGQILMIGHGASVLGATWGLVGGQPEINPALCCLVKLVRDRQAWVMELNGDTSHLSQSESSIRFH
jgi:broad specificity phosphatase PhoE